MRETAARRDDPADGGRRRARRAPPGAAAHRVRRPARARPDVETVCEAISATTEATLEAALQIALRAVAAERGLAELPLRFAIIAMGRLGGAEVGYGSDADVMFVFEPLGDAGRGRRARSRRTSPAGCARCCPRRRRPTRRWASTPTCVRRAATARWCVRSRPTRSTTRAGRRRGRRRRCCGPASRAGDAELGRAVHRDDRPGALPGGRGARRPT